MAEIVREFEGYAVEDRNGIQFFGEDKEALRLKGEHWAIFHGDWEVWLRKVTVQVHGEERVRPTPP